MSMFKSLFFVVGFIIVAFSSNSYASNNFSPVLFGDVSQKLDYIHSSLAFGGEGLAGVAVIDFNNDGHMDIFMTNGKTQPAGLFKNNGDGTFTNVSSSANVNSITGHSGVVAGDVDNDGFVDLLVLGEGDVYAGTGQSPVKLFRNSGDGTFSDITASSTIVGPETAMMAAMADINNDGFLDLFITAPGDFQKQVQHSSKLYLNNGELTYSDITNSAGISNADLGACVAGFSDYDNDGDSDLFVGNCYDVTFAPTPFQLYRNDGTGNFTDVTTESGLSDVLGFWMSMSFADYDRDGDIDFYSTSFGQNTNFLFGFPDSATLAHGLFRNNGNGTFTNTIAQSGIETGEFGWGGLFADFDNDSDMDIFHNGSLPAFSVITPGLASPGRLLISTLNNTKNDVVFVDKTEDVGVDLATRFSSGSAFGDFNNDGFQDIIIMTETFSEAGTPVLLENSGNKNNWISFKLVGVESNRDAIGAKVTVRARGRSQVQEVYAGSSYMSSSTKLLTFGLARSGSVQKITVAWPSGCVEEISDIDVNAVNRVVEGMGEALSSACVSS